MEDIRACLSDGTPPNVRDEHRWAALHYAAAEGHVEICELLLDAKGDVNLQLPDFSTALMLAAEEGNLKVALLLLDRGAQTRVVDEAGFTAWGRCDVEAREEFARCVQRHGRA